MFINPLYANDGYTRHKYMRKLKRMTCIDVNDDERPLAGRPAAVLRSKYILRLPEPFCGVRVPAAFLW
jgi:hypothetical protein